MRLLVLLSFVTCTYTHLSVQSFIEQGCEAAPDVHLGKQNFLRRAAPRVSVNNGLTEESSYLR